MTTAHELTLGRTLGVSVDHGEDFFTGLKNMCAQHGIRQGYIPMFIAGFLTVDNVGACDKLDDPHAPVWSPSTPTRHRSAHTSTSQLA